MPIKPLDRLLFAQGGVCFFCHQVLPKSEASVEHLVASSNGGSNNDENCVVCCKAVNALFGSMSLKEKIKVVLNQKGQFKCPNGSGVIKAASKAKSAATPPKIALDDNFRFVLTNLKQRGHSRPRRLKTLTSTLASLFSNGLSEAELDALIQQLQSSGKVTISGNKVTYSI